MRVESTSITVISFALQELASLGMTLAIGTVSLTVSVVGGHT
jgi:hypothetical protein